MKNVNYYKKIIKYIFKAITMTGKPSESLAQTVIQIN